MTHQITGAEKRAKFQSRLWPLRDGVSQQAFDGLFSAASNLEKRMKFGHSQDVVQIAVDIGEAEFAALVLDERLERDEHTECRR